MTRFATIVSSGQLDKRNLFNLAPDGVYRAPRCYQRGRWALTLRHLADPPKRTPFHPCPEPRREPGGLFSVALSLGLPLLRVTERPALRSSDFPPCTQRYRATTLPALIYLTIFSPLTLFLPAGRPLCSLPVVYDIYYNI